MRSPLGDRGVAEIDENLCRADLTPSQRAKFTAARKKAYVKAHPETKKGGDRKSEVAKDQSANSAHRSPAFIDETAAKTGRSRRAVAQDVARAEALGDDIDRVSGTSLDKCVEMDAPMLPRDLFQI